MSFSSFSWGLRKTVLVVLVRKQVVIFAVFVKTPSFSGTNFCTGDFAPPEPELNSGKQILDARILDPNFLGRIF